MRFFAKYLGLAKTDPINARALALYSACSDIWFCDPHGPWQRGTVEDMNGVIRRDIPRRSDNSDYSRRDIEMLQVLINSTPRKCLDFRTPLEAFEENRNGALQM